MCCSLQVAKIRHSILMPAEQPRELTAADRHFLAENHKKRLAEVVSKQCAQALRHVQSHKVSIPMALSGFLLHHWLPVPA